MAKKKKKAIKSVKTLRNKADKLLQELGRLVYDKCLVCKKPMSCLHHYYPKSSSSALRYNMHNLIPICKGCHFQHHNGNPEIHNKVNIIMGKDWLELLQEEKTDIIKVSKGYYINQIELLNELIKNYE